MKCRELLEALTKATQPMDFCRVCLCVHSNFKDASNHKEWCAWAKADAFQGCDAEKALRHIFVTAEEQLALFPADGYWLSVRDTAALALPSPAQGEHVHTWVDARNEVIKSGAICADCGAIWPDQNEKED